MDEEADDGGKIKKEAAKSPDVSGCGFVARDSQC